jgi:hypothetical protein
MFILTRAFGFDSLRSKWNAPIFFQSFVCPKEIIEALSSFCGRNDSGPYHLKEFIEALRLNRDRCHLYILVYFVIDSMSASMNVGWIQQRATSFHNLLQLANYRHATVEIRYDSSSLMFICTVSFERHSFQSTRVQSTMGCTSEIFKRVIPALSQKLLCIWLKGWWSGYRRKSNY